MSKTAVEWLIEMISYTSKDTHSAMESSNFFEQAKSMERAQIVEAFQTEWSQHNYSGEQYYANTYGKEASDEEHS